MSFNLGAFHVCDILPFWATSNNRNKPTKQWDLSTMIRRPHQHQEQGQEKLQVRKQVILQQNYVPQTSTPSQHLSWSALILNLQRQHIEDLTIYRAAHQEWRNRMIHWLMIPVECWSALTCCTVLISCIIRMISSSLSLSSLSSSTLTIIDEHQENVSYGIVVTSIEMSVGMGLGILSLLISTNIFVGILTFLFHSVASWTCVQLQNSYGNTYALLVAAISWTVAWMVQVGVGHWVLEGNQPNVSNMTEVSYLAMCQSVLIAWSS